MNQEKKQARLQQIQNFDEIPIQQKKRNCTDVCCLITGLSFSLIIIVTAIVLFNKTTFFKVNFPTDSDGKLCGYDYPEYQYLFFSNAPLINARVCVSKCPSKGDITLNCRNNALVKTCNFNPLNKYYDSVAERTRMGFFCYPTDKILKELVKQAAHLTGQQAFYESLDSIKLSLIVASALSLVYFILVQIMPKVMNYSIVGLSLIALIFTTIKIFTFETQDTIIRTLLGIVFIFVVILIAVSLYKNSISLKIHAVLLSYGSAMIKQRFSIILYIILYSLMIILFVGLIMFQFIGFWTNGRTIFVPAQYIYYKLQGFTVSAFVTIIIGIQFVWGAGFLKESYNYCISGNAIAWFFGKMREDKYQNGTFYPLKLQIMKNIGSVIACSFITSFFAIFDLIFDIFKPTDKNSAYGKACDCFCSCFMRIWDLVRSDAMSYLILSGNPLCNSARYCQYLCDKTVLTSYSQSCSRIYRISAHFFMASLTLLYSFFMTQNKSIYACLIILIGALIISTFFISMHADAAEAIQIIYLFDQEFLHRGENELKHNKQGLAIATTRKEIAEEIFKEYHGIETQNSPK